jgi:hypothetical protein
MVRVTHIAIVAFFIVKFLVATSCGNGGRGRWGAIFLLLFYVIRPVSKKEEYAEREKREDDAYASLYV